jgi:hypothetical protein
MTGDGATPGRRQLLKTLGASALAATVAGCGGGSTSTTPTGTQPPAGATGSTQTAGATTTTPSVPDCDTPTTLARSDVNGGATLERGCYLVENVHTIDSGTLTLEPGARIQFGTEAGFDLTGGGRLQAAGTADEPVVLQGKTAERGHWQGVRLADVDDASRFEHTIVEHAGGSLWTGNLESKTAVYLKGATATFDAVTFRENANNALLAFDSDVSMRVERTLFESNDHPARVNAALVGAFGPGTTVRDNDDDRVRLDGSGSKDAIVADGTVAALGVPWHVTTNVALRSTLTVSEGAEFAFKKKKGLDVNGGELRVEGSSSAPVRFRGVTSGRGAWRGIRLRGQDDGSSPSNVLRHAVITGAGGALWTGNELTKCGLLVGETATVENCTFTQNAHSGLTAYGSGYDFSVEQCLFENNELPLYLPADYVGDVAASNAFMGNDEPYVLIGWAGPQTPVKSPARWVTLDVPYRIKHHLRLEAPLVIEPGTTVQAADSKQIAVKNGYLQADASGSDEPPIFFTGAESTRGHWGGIGIENEHQKNALKNVVIEFGGGELWTGDLDTKANLVVGGWGDGIAPEVTLSDVTIRKSGKHGIYEYASGMSCSDVRFEDNAGAAVYDGHEGAPASGC